jgi:hypothetical protein
VGEFRKIYSERRFLSAALLLLLSAAILTGCGSDNSASNGSGGDSNPGTSNPGSNGGEGSGGSYVYVGNKDQRIDGYKINSTDGSVAAISGSPFQQGTKVADMCSPTIRSFRLISMAI